MQQTTIQQPQPTIDAGKLWLGGLITAIVAAGVAIVGFIVVRGILDLPVLGVDSGGNVIFPSIFGYAFTAGLITLALTGLLHLLLLGAPSPRAFFGWIGALCTVIAALIPFTLDMPTETQIATACINVAIGAIVIGLLLATASSSVRPGAR